MPRRPAPVLPDPSGTTVLLTGASSGIGQAAATRLLAAGAHLIPVGRSPERTRALADAWGVTGYTADYARLESVRTLALQIAADHPVIDALWLRTEDLLGLEPAGS